MATTTTFLALQCTRCSTMQVKQQKKSSNKWVCVVCNLRQSVCRVYARGPRARDLRMFVQDFNMSRMENALSGSTDLPLSAPDSDQHTDLCQPTKRTNWSEYLDPVGDIEDDINKENELDVEVVTEISQRKLKYTSSRYQKQDDGNKLMHKNTLKRKRGHEGHNNQGNSCSNAGKEATKCMSSNQQSKWSDYLDDTNEKEEIGDEPVQGGNYRLMPYDAKEKIATEHLVEDEVHPDFI